MACLGSKHYDPAVAVTKGTAAAAMTAIDTTNLRIGFTVPASGRVLYRLKGTIHGATTFSQFVLGILEGSTVRARQVPMGALLGTAVATTMVPIEATGVIEGLTPAASLTWDAAFGVETFVASSLLKYGGPNDTTANNAFGAFIFELWEA